MVCGAFFLSAYSDSGTPSAVVVVYLRHQVIEEEVDYE
jgi:hypothetical protein